MCLFCFFLLSVSLLFDRVSVYVELLTAVSVWTGLRLKRTRYSGIPTVLYRDWGVEGGLCIRPPLRGHHTPEGGALAAQRVDPLPLCQF